VTRLNKLPRYALLDTYGAGELEPEEVTEPEVTDRYRKVLRHANRRARQAHLRGYVALCAWTFFFCGYAFWCATGGQTHLR
jgi:hypothetical protein